MAADASFSMASSRTEPLYQKEGQLYRHTAPISALLELSLLPAATQALFKVPEEGTPFVVTCPRTIFHAQGGGQPSDTGTLVAGDASFEVMQVRSQERAILHMGRFAGPARFAPDEEACQSVHVETRVLHSRIHTAGHVLGLAAAALKSAGLVPADVVDGKASHYPGAAFVEFNGLIPSDVKDALQEETDKLVARNLAVNIHFWDEARARRECAGELTHFDPNEGVRVMEVEGVGSYPCGGTHVTRTGECGRIVVRRIKRQKGVTKVSYEVQDV